MKFGVSIYTIIMFLHVQTMLQSEFGASHKENYYLALQQIMAYKKARPYNYQKM
jgi:hypothetical protein